MLIEGFELEVFTPPCDPTAVRYCARAHLRVDISEVLPYLNATLKDAKFHKNANSLTWRENHHMAAFRPYEIAASNLEDREEATQQLQKLIDLVNRTWEIRDFLTPSYHESQRPLPVEIYKQLPNTNCRECGELTCYNFALKLAAGKMTLDSCPTIYDSGYADKLETLKSMLT